MLRNHSLSLVFLFCLSGFIANAAPVEFLKLCVNERGKTINLIWETALEVNNSHFLIERSTDEENYKVIGQVDGNGTVFETTYYEFEDDDPIEGTSFYRLKQVDLNGEFSYSETVEVSNYMKLQANKLQLFPNPAPPEEIVLLIEPEGDESTELEACVYSLRGLKLAENVFNQPGRHSLSGMLANLNDGTYLIQFSNASGYIQSKLIIIQR